MTLAKAQSFDEFDSFEFVTVEKTADGQINWIETLNLVSTQRKWMDFFFKKSNV